MDAGDVHVFEAAGLGKAPFRLAGYHEDRGPKMIGAMTQVGRPGQAMGTCAYCGASIAHVFTIESSDGRRFTVGSECVRKTGNGGLRAAVNRKLREARICKEEARIQNSHEVWNACSKLRDLACSLPHPNAGMAHDGLTLADYIVWMFDNAGHSGLLKVARVIEKLQSDL